MYNTSRRLPYLNIDDVPTELKVAESPPTIYETSCILIDSRSRNLTQYPSSNKFRVKFGASDKTTNDAFITKHFKNIRSIKLQDIVIPSTISDYPYIVMKIPELQDSFFGTTEISRRGFALLFPDFSTMGGQFTNFRVKTTNCNCFKVFNPPISVTNLTFEFYDPNGDLIAAPTELTIDDGKQIAFTLQIETEIPNNPLKSSFT